MLFINNYTLIILALIFPPIPVIIKNGPTKDNKLLFNLFWNFIGYIPGVLHSIFVITEDIDQKFYIREKKFGYGDICLNYPLTEMTPVRIERGDSEDSQGSSSGSDSSCALDDFSEQGDSSKDDLLV